MENKLSQYHVGIDLGTTHTVVAYARKDKPSEIRLLDIDQLVAPGQVAALPLLPSVRYHPAEGEVSIEDLFFMQPDSNAVIGQGARVLGAKTKGRLVTSAKSWLSHPSVDHQADILPWGSHEDIAKVSPVEASASYLRHVRTAWEHTFPDSPLSEQDTVLTVPASFDEDARSLTLLAAEKAGLRRVRLLEEPQAVCYDWLRRHAGKVSQALADTRLILVCDIGGGTTDLTLIRVEHEGDEPKLTRIAVGDHIMLGGDNIDLALAHLAESRLANDSSRLSAAELTQLIEQCRTAKERLLADDAPEQVTVTLLGGGAKLIGGARSVALSQEDTRKIALDGFFPLSGLNELPEKKRSGVVEFGLPFAAEPAISKHIAAFLNLHKEAASAALQSDIFVPDALLLNGGLFNSQAITQRVIQLCKTWKSSEPLLLENKHPEFAVAYGAVSYAIARQDKKLKIGGGSARSYFLLIDTGSAHPEAQKVGICVLPKGSEEGQEIVLHDRLFALRTGIPVRFDLASYSGDSTAKPGDIVEITDAFQALPPLIAAFDHKSSQEKSSHTVELGVTPTEVGTLKIQCIAVGEAGQTIETTERQRWNVEFQIRRTRNQPFQEETDLLPQTPIALAQIQSVFGPKSKDIDPNAVKNLRANLEKTLGKERSSWDSPLLRRLFSGFWDGHKYRRRSEHHERVWLSLTGFCLRPGFGFPLDDWRIDQLRAIYDLGIQFVNENQNWSEWWTLWRRVAGGLDAPFQEKIYADVAKYINPAALKQATTAKQAKLKSSEDMIRLAATLERISADKKIKLGDWLVKRLEKNNDPQSWWALGRVGARIPFHGGSHNVVPAATASVWLTAAMAQDWKRNPQAAFAATLIARNSGDRALDIDENLRNTVIDKLKQFKLPQTWQKMVESHIQLDEKEESQVFGESLPTGLKLIDPDR